MHTVLTFYYRFQVSESRMGHAHERLCSQHPFTTIICFGPQFHYTSKTLAFMEPFSSIAKRFPSPLSILSLWNQFPACFGPQFHYTSKTLAFMEPFSNIVAKRFPSPLSILSLWNQFPACFGPQFHYTLAFMEPFSSSEKVPITTKYTVIMEPVSSMFWTPVPLY